MASLSGDEAGGDVRIRGAGFDIVTPDFTSDQASIRLHFLDTRHRIPARGFELIFMPESGPFVKMATDSKGAVTLPSIDQPGILRIEGKPPQLVYIRLDILR